MKYSFKFVPSPSVCRIWSILRQRGQEQVSSFVTKTKKFISKTKGRFTIRRACAFQSPNQSRRYHWARRGAFTPPDFVRSVNPISIRGGKIMPTTLLLAPPDFQTCLRTFSELTSYLGMDPTSQRQKTFLKVQIRRCTSRHFSCFSAAPYQLVLVYVKKHFFFFCRFFRNGTFLFRKFRNRRLCLFFVCLQIKLHKSY